jgi:RNA 2',3'-cyclic 3'-phosphodiesterase
VRLFVGVFPPAQVRADLKRALPPGLRLTPRDRWHVTLAFLGDVAAQRLGDIQRALDAVPPSGGVELRLAGTGRFGKGKSAALWVGVVGDLAALSRLHDDIQGALVAADLPRDDRPFRPHLTVAYTRGGEVPEVWRALHALETYTGPAWRADEFVLVRSRFAEGGGYVRLKAWPC